MKSVNSQAMLSRHARDRMALLVTEREVRNALSDPLSIFPGGPGHPPGRRTIVGQSVLVVVAGDVVVTVKLRTKTPYIHGVHTRFNYPQPTSHPFAA